MDAGEERKIKRIRKLMKEILRYKQLYYSGNPVVSDSIYDVYERQLESMDPNNPVVHMVGFNPNYTIPRGYVPDPEVSYTPDGIFKGNKLITWNDVGNPKA